MKPLMIGRKCWQTRGVGGQISAGSHSLRQAPGLGGRDAADAGRCAGGTVLGVSGSGGTLPSAPALGVV